MSFFHRFFVLNFVGFVFLGGCSDEVQGPEVDLFDPMAFGSYDLVEKQRIPCLLVDPISVNFGTVELNGLATKTIEVTNCSPNSDTIFSVVSIEGSPEFSLLEDVTDVVLQPEETRLVSVLFTPTQPGPYAAKINLISDDFLEPDRTINLLGNGKNLPCPTAIIRGSVQNGNSERANPTAVLGALPLDFVNLDASDSFDSEGDELTYEWTLIQRPTDSAARLETQPDPSHQRLWLDLAGEYLVELTVDTPRDEPSCQAARLRILAVADQDIHIQLVWDTPNDPNQLDANGSDIDLHFLHRNGTWDRSPWDCFWGNPNPDWGAPSISGIDDDPSLDIDDLNGWGPENINLDLPQPANYEVGVYYFDDHGYGTSYATVRVYLGGVLAREFSRQRLTSQDFWHVAQIQWTSGQVIPVNSVTQGFP